MGHHVDSKGRFQSDKYPDLPPDKIVISFKDKHALNVLCMYSYLTEDRELAQDIITRLNSLYGE